MAECVNTSDGTQLPLSDVLQTFDWTDTGFLSTITVVYQNKTFVQTFTNDGTYYDTISGWILQ